MNGKAAIGLSNRKLRVFRPSHIVDDQQAGETAVFEVCSQVYGLPTSCPLFYALWSENSGYDVGNPYTCWMKPQYGAPAYLRSDNGPEFVAVAVQRWLAQRQITTVYIDPGCPWQNGKEERFNGTVRDECLNMHIFASTIEASVRLSAFRHHYNEERPHSALGYQTPSEFKCTWFATQQKSDDPNITT